MWRATSDSVWAWPSWLSPLPEGFDLKGEAAVSLDALSCLLFCSVESTALSSLYLPFRALSLPGTGILFARLGKSLCPFGALSLGAEISRFGKSLFDSPALSPTRVGPHFHFLDFKRVTEHPYGVRRTRI